MTILGRHVDARRVDDLFEHGSELLCELALRAKGVDGVIGAQRLFECVQKSNLDRITLEERRFDRNIRVEQIDEAWLAVSLRLLILRFGERNSSIGNHAAIEVTDNHDEEVAAAYFVRSE